MSNNTIPTKMVMSIYKVTDQPIVCGWCGHKSLMYLICSGVGTELFDSAYSDYEEWCADHEWQVLMCPSCKEVNVLHVSRYEFYTTVKNGEEIEEAMYHQPTYLYPNRDLSIPNSHPDMPLDVRRDYEEAREVCNVSARSAAALLRLAIQKLCKALGEKGNNINDDIGELVKKGLPEHVQQALDIVRVIGNESVHPGEINVQDNGEVAQQLFELVNEIVDDRIGKLNRQIAIKNIYQDLPKSKLDSIVKRDSAKPKD